jgi:hypothetical protein
MIDSFVKQWEAKKDTLRAKFAAAHPEDYAAIVKGVVELLDSDDYYESPDSERVHQIDDGDYQGTLVFVIGAKGYQPSEYWYVKVGYGSCSGCDALENIRSYSGVSPTQSQIDDYMTLALHILQGIKKMGDEAEE